MALETFEFIDDLNASNPVGATDAKNEGDNHLRGIKTTLKNTFPNFTGAVTATHTELNLLDGVTATTAELNKASLLTNQDGAVLTYAIADAGGSVDAITADFTPNVTLTDKTTVLVRALGANTSTTVTFAPDGLTAKNVKKYGNQALEISEIYAAGHVLILQYNSSNDVWELLNPKEAPGTTVSNYVQSTYFYMQNATASSLSLSTYLAESTWVDIGPTGSGATYIWSALDSLPSNTKSILFTALATLQDTSTAHVTTVCSLRKNSSDSSKYIMNGNSYLTAATAFVLNGSPNPVAVQSGNIFEAYWSCSADTTQSVTITLLGFYV